MSNIGICVSTCDRPEYIESFIESIHDNGHIVCVCDDGHDPVKNVPKDMRHIRTDKPRSGVAKNKNNGLKYLIDSGCEYIFCFEDDCTVENYQVFNEYIEASEKTGIQHFNFGPGSPWNRKQQDASIIGDLSKRMLASQQGEPMPKMVVDYGINDINIALYTHVVGMMSFFTRKCIDIVGLYDEDFYNAWEHVDHTLRIIDKNMHPPFWYFADIENSCDYIKEQKDEKANTSLSKDEDEFNRLVHDGAMIFKNKHGRVPGQIKHETPEVVKQQLKYIYLHEDYNRV